MHEERSTAAVFGILATGFNAAYAIEGGSAVYGTAMLLEVLILATALLVATRKPIKG